MGLAVKQGNEVTFTFEGEDEDAAYEAISAFVKETCKKKAEHEIKPGSN